MLDIPEEVKELFRADNNKRKTQKKIRLYFYAEEGDSLYPSELLFPSEELYPSEHGEPWLIIENDRIISESLQITESLCSNNELAIGSCEGSEMQITVVNVIEDIVGKEFVLTIEVNGYEMALGIYTVKSFERQSDRRKRKITAYDRMSWFNVDVTTWYNDLVFPISLKSFRDSFCDYIGIIQEKTDLIFDSLQIEKTISSYQLYGLDVLKAICELNGCFGHVDRTGQLKYVRLQRTGLYPSETLYPEETLYPSEIGGDGNLFENIDTYRQPMIYEDYLVEGITGISIKDSDGKLLSSVGSNENEYIISGNFLVYGKSAVEMIEISNSLLAQIDGWVYRPVEVECNFYPWLEVGDAIRVFTRNDLVESYIMNRTISGCQSMKDKISSKGMQHRENKESLHNKLEKSEWKMITIEKTIDSVSVTLEDFEKNTLSKLEATDTQISAEVTRAKKEEEKLSAAIKVNADNIILKVSKGDVSAQLSQESGNVHIKGNRFSWQSTNSSMTADGTLNCNNIKAEQSSFSGKVSGSKIVGGTITGTSIIGNNITATSIDAATISGSNINLDVLVAAPQMQNDDDLAAEDGAEVNIQNISTRNIVCNSDEPSQIDWVRCSDTYVGPWPEEDSDVRLKKNICNIKEQDAMKMVLSKRPVSYFFRKSKIPSMGFIAQEVKQASEGLPFENSMYSIDKNGFFCIPYLNDIGLLTSCIQNLKKRIDNIKCKENKT